LQTGREEFDMEFFHKVSAFPFMHTRKVWYGISTAAMICSILLLIFRGLNLGIDFTGGVVIELAYSQPTDVEHTRAALRDAGIADAQVQNIGTSREVMIRVLPQGGDTKKASELNQRVVAALKQIDPNVELKRTDEVGSQVGDELFETAGLALLITFLGILIYVALRFVWKLGVGAVLAALHDPIIILGAFALTQLTFDLSAVAAILAVIGYSLNDTVVVFDRVRDNFLSMRNATPSEVMDASVNQTLSRTVITSGVTLMVVVVLLIFGGESLKPFSAALTVGIIVGTYSSIYVAGAVALDLGLTVRDLLPVHKNDAELDALP
jgi:preprotein translocase subunit SecF